MLTKTQKRNAFLEGMASVNSIYCNMDLDVDLDLENRPVTSTPFVLDREKVINSYKALNIPYINSLMNDYVEIIKMYESDNINFDLFEIKDFNESWKEFCQEINNNIGEAFEMTAKAMNLALKQYEYEQARQ